MWAVLRLRVTDVGIYDWVNTYLWDKLKKKTMQNSFYYNFYTHKVYCCWRKEMFVLYISTYSTTNMRWRWSLLIIEETVCYVLKKKTFSNKSIDISINDLASVWSWSVRNATFSIISLYSRLSAIKCESGRAEHYMVQ